MGQFASSDAGLLLRPEPHQGEMSVGVPGVRDVAPGKRTRTERLPLQRKGPPGVERKPDKGDEKTEKDPPDTGDDPFGMHLLNEGGRSSGPKLRATPAKVPMPAARVGESSSYTVTLTNRVANAVRIADLIPQRGKYPQGEVPITSTAIDKTYLDPGESAKVELRFAPKRMGRQYVTLVVETEEGPDIAIRAAGQGLASLADALKEGEPGAAEEKAKKDADERAFVVRSLVNQDRKSVV